MLIPNYSKIIKDSTNVNPSQSVEYTNTEEHTYVIMYLVSSNSSRAIATINGKEISEAIFSHSIGAVGIALPIFLPKGNTLKITAASTNDSSFIVYGV